MMTKKGYLTDTNERSRLTPFQIRIEKKDGKEDHCGGELALGKEVHITVTKSHMHVSQPNAQGTNGEMIDEWNIDSSLCPNREVWIRIVLVGDVSSGKTALMIRATEHCFNNTSSTCGVNFKVYMFDIKGEIVRATIWDTAGQERFLTITQSYYTNANGFVVVYDVTNANSFKNVEKWVTDVRKRTQRGGDVAGILVGNKIDMFGLRKVATREGQKLAISMGLQFLETSAKTGDNVDAVFSLLAQKCVFARDGVLRSTTTAMLTPRNLSVTDGLLPLTVATSLKIPNCLCNC